jgi:hypothetical protein
MATITILSPVAEARRDEGRREASAERRLGPRIRLGLLSNGKPNTDHLIAGLLEVLESDRRLETSVRERKASASQPAEEAILARLVSSADLVVGATAD